METIDFNEVIRDPETISVVGELIGTVTPTQNGLMTPSQYFNCGLQFSGEAHLFKIASISPSGGIMVNYGDMLVVNRSNNALITNVSFSLATSDSADINKRGVSVIRSGISLKFVTFYINSEKTDLYAKFGGGADVLFRVHTTGTAFFRPEQVDSSIISSLSEVKCYDLEITKQA